MTGAAGGIGSAIAARLARDGFRVACSDRAAADAERAASEIEGAAGFGCDLRSEHAVAELRDVVTAELGAPWLLVNAAGVFFEHEVTELVDRAVGPDHGRERARHVPDLPRAAAGDAATRARAASSTSPRPRG